MKSLSISFLWACVAIQTLRAQGTAKKFSDEEEAWHIGLTMSTTRYYGDLSGPYQFANLQLAWAVEAHLRYRFTYRATIRADVGAYALRGDQQFTQNRSNYLTFKTINPSVNVGFQWDLRSVRIENNVMYLFGFLGLTHMNPETMYQAVSYALAPLHTEGIAYEQWAGQGGYGVGLPFIISRRMLLRIEASYTHVFSDYVDDVSTVYADKTTRPMIEQVLADPRVGYGSSANLANAQRGNWKRNDGYVKFGAQLSLKL
jgi:hypothetical protein